jgi:hypothetical protein
MCYIVQIGIVRNSNLIWIQSNLQIGKIEKDLTLKNVHGPKPNRCGLGSQPRRHIQAAVGRVPTSLGESNPLSEDLAH